MRGRESVCKLSNLFPLNSGHGICLTFGGACFIRRQKRVSIKLRAVVLA